MTTTGWSLCSPTLRRTEKSIRRTGTVRWTSGRLLWCGLAGTAAPCVSTCKTSTKASGGKTNLRWVWGPSSSPWLGSCCCVSSVTAGCTCSHCVLPPARSGKIQRESEFAANVDCGWLSWGVGLLLVKPLKWTFSTLLGSSRVSLEESFVVIELVKVCQCFSFQYGLTCTYTCTQMYHLFFFSGESSRFTQSLQNE